MKLENKNGIKRERNSFESFSTTSNHLSARKLLRSFYKSTLMTKISLLIASIIFKAFFIFEKKRSRAKLDFQSIGIWTVQVLYISSTVPVPVLVLVPVQVPYFTLFYFCDVYILL
jgi:hypothetical protein